MLSRVADALFWMSRYLERAEHVALLLDVCFHLELDLRGVLSAPSGLHWTSLAVILQQIYYRFHRGQTNDERFRTLNDRVRHLIAWAAESVESA